MATSQSSIVVQMTSDEARLLEGMRKIIEKESQMTDGLTKAEKEAAKTERAMNKMAERIKEINTTPLEKFNRDMQRADELLKKGKLTQEEFNRELARQSAIYHQRNTQEESFAGAIRRTAAELLGMQTIVQGIEKAFGSVEQAREKALGGYRGLEESNRRLNQIADTDPNSSKSYTALQERADAAAAMYGVDRVTAREVLFAAHSEGFAADYEKIMSSKAVVDPKSAARVAGQIPAIFGGAVTPIQARDLTLTAARESRLDYEKLSAAMPIASEGMAMQGASFAETAAVLGVLAGKFSTGETTGQRIKLLASKFAVDPEYRGMGLMKAFDKLAAKSEEEQRAFLGESTELNPAFEAIKDLRPTIVQKIAEMEVKLAESAAGNGEVAQGIVRANQNKMFGVTEDANRSKIVAEISRERVSGVNAAAAESLRNRAIEASYAIGGENIGAATESLLNSTLGRAGAEIGVRAARTTFDAVGPLGTPYLAQLAATATGFVGGGNEEKVSAAADKLQQAANALNDAAQKQVPAAARAKAAFGKEQ